MTVVNINDLEAILRLKNGIASFSRDIPPRIADVDRYIDNVVNELKRAEAAIVFKLEDAERKLGNQNNMLTLCRSRVEYDDEGHRKSPDCHSEERAVQRAKIELDAARKNLLDMQELMRYVEKSLGEYAGIRNGYKTLVTDYSQSAMEVLDSIYRLGNEYQDLSKLYDNV
jgi:hypothetical protein